MRGKVGWAALWVIGILLWRLFGEPGFRAQEKEEKLARRASDRGIWRFRAGPGCLIDGKKKKKRENSEGTAHSVYTKNRKGKTREKAILICCRGSILVEPEPDSGIGGEGAGRKRAPWRGGGGSRFSYLAFQKATVLRDRRRHPHHAAEMGGHHPRRLRCCSCWRKHRFPYRGAILERAPKMAKSRWGMDSTAILARDWGERGARFVCRLWAIKNALIAKGEVPGAADRMHGGNTGRARLTPTGMYPLLGYRGN